MAEKCFGCENGMKALEKHDEEAFKKYGWYAHAVSDEPALPFGMNYHTHGLFQNYKHKDLQVCLPLDMEIIHAIVTTVVGRIKAGEKFEAGEKVYGIIQGDYPVTFMESEECDRPVLRIIFPDESGCLEKEEMGEKFAEQWD